MVGTPEGGSSGAGGTGGSSGSGTGSGSGVSGSSSGGGSGSGGGSASNLVGQGASSNSVQRTFTFMNPDGSTFDRT